jgi:2,4'-dihydroxyacetophenone dioxygenase
MPEAATSEFWRDIEPIPNAFKPGVPPEVYMRDPANSDEKYFIPLTATVLSRPLWISRQQNMWADILWAKKAGLVPETKR